MLNNTSEVAIIVICGTSIMFLLVSTIVFFVLSYQKRYLQHQQKIKALEYAFTEELLKSELEIKEQTMNNIASEIHDHIGQLLSVIKLNLALNPAPGLTETKDLVAQVIKDVRGLAHSMHSDGISNKPLSDLIQTETVRLNKLSECDIRFNITGSPFLLENKIEVLLFRIFQEGINNIIKHASAKNISIELIYHISLFTLKIIDDGDGFDSNNMIEGLGLKSMRYRAGLIGAKFVLDSNPGKGTSLEIHLDNISTHGN